LKAKELEGKTIQKAEIVKFTMLPSDILNITFTDGSHIEIFATRNSELRYTLNIEKVK
jgi:hypothetical protein